MQNPFTWASGLKSPIYCDNRKILSFPEARKFVAQSLSEIATEEFVEADTVAGVATGGIAHGVLTAAILNKPFVYVRSSSKGHGLQNLIEGQLEKGSKVVVVEDLVSTGKSSLEAVDALKKNDAEILGMIAVFTYGLEAAVKNFKDYNCKLVTLSNYEALVHQAKKLNLIEDMDEIMLKKWSENPHLWSDEFLKLKN